jgi:hypothetical protein
MGKRTPQWGEFRYFCLLFADKDPSDEGHFGLDPPGLMLPPLSTLYLRLTFVTGSSQTAAVSYAQGSPSNEGGP